MCQGDTAERAIQDDFRAMVTSHLREEEVTSAGKTCGQIGFHIETDYSVLCFRRYDQMTHTPHGQRF